MDTDTDVWSLRCRRLIASSSFLDVLCGGSSCRPRQTCRRSSMGRVGSLVELARLWSFLMMHIWISRQNVHETPLAGGLPRRRGRSRLWPRDPCRGAGRPLDCRCLRRLQWECLPLSIDDGGLVQMWNPLWRMSRSCHRWDAYLKGESAVDVYTKNSTMVEHLLLYWVYYNSNFRYVQGNITEPGFSVPNDPSHNWEMTGHL